MTELLDIGILGADGRMGASVLKVLDAEPRARLTVALTSPKSESRGQDAGAVAGLRDCGVLLTSDIQEGLAACDVLIDFSSPKAAIDAALSMYDARCKTLITGTTGYTETEESALLAASESITLLKSGNFSLGVNLLEILVETASRALTTGWDIEILEMHHKHKVDAPSGTALMLGEAAAQGRGVPLKDIRVPVRDGISAPRLEGEIGFAALRGGGVIGAHEVRIASALEMITLSHDAFDRSVFASGAVAAALWAATKPKGLYTMKDMLGLPRETDG